MSIEAIGLRTGKRQGPVGKIGKGLPQMSKIETSIESTKVGETEIVFASLPAATIGALLSRGISHYFGNELAARVSGAKAAFRKIEGSDELGPEMSDDEVAKVRETKFAEFLDKLVSGTVGVRAPGITVDPIEKIVQRIAKQEVSNILKTAGLKVPKAGEAVEFADGSKKSLEAMIERRLEVNGEAIRKQAEKEVKALAAQKAKLEAEVKAAPTASAADLGL